MTSAEARTAPPGVGDGAAVRAAARLVADLPPWPAARCSGLRERYGGGPRSRTSPCTWAGARSWGLLDPNGAGTTTVIKTLLGLVHPDAGEVMLLGRAAADPAARTHVGYLPELFRYQPWLSAAEVLALHVRLSGVDVSGGSSVATGRVERAGDWFTVSLPTDGEGATVPDLVRDPGRAGARGRARTISLEERLLGILRAGQAGPMAGQR